jgi:hypothetical protein
MIKSLPHFIAEDMLQNPRIDSYLFFMLNKQYDRFINKKDYKLWSFECFNLDEEHNLFKRTQYLTQNKVWHRRKNYGKL